MAGRLRPRTMPEWMRWVEGRLRRLDSRVAVSVPVGGAVLWIPTDPTPAGWLAANGATFDATDYPELSARLGGATTVPTLTAVSGRTWIIRAE